LKKTNPNKAVAVSYGDNPVPVVVAKGQGAVASIIIDEAARQGVPIMQDLVLTERLSRLPVGAPIPEEAYRAVAVVLAWVYWLQGKTPP